MIPNGTIMPNGEHMNLSLEELKELILFARESGVKHLKYGRISIDFTDLILGNAFLSDESPKADPEQEKKDYHETLLASSH